MSGPMVHGSIVIAALADRESSHPHPAVHQSWPVFHLALFLVRFLQKTALLSVQSIIFAKK